MADESGDKKKTVWILGSGFSRALGGPLLKGLLSKSALYELQATFPELANSQEFERAQIIFEYGVNTGFWDDAETFLDRLDVAGRNSDSGPGRQMRVAFNNTYDDLVGVDAATATAKFFRLSGEARRFVALQCRRFTDSYDHGLESWGAYHSWVTKLQETGAIHTILTFNYDLVLEKLKIWTPITRFGEGQEPHDRPEGGQTKVGGLKLHGSVDWRKSGASNRYEKAPDTWALSRCDPKDIAIAPPGPSKRECVDGPLKALWQVGLDVIRNADSIVFVGYRFPPSDAEARSKILDAIRCNKAKNGLTLNIVLGPRLSSSRRKMRIEQERS